jgi:zinc protease
VGAKEDPVGKAGIAHLAEHIMFQLKPDGQQNPPLMHFLGQMSTFFNAYTSPDSTHYMIQARAEQLDDMLKIEAMRMAFAAGDPLAKDFGCMTLDNAEFERERDVVRNEIRGSSSPEGQIPQLVLSAVYPDGHAYARDVGGNDKQIASMTLEETCQFLHDYYVPENATVIIAGGVDYEETVELVKKWFGKLQRRAAKPNKAVEPVEVTPGREEIDLDIERNVVAISWPLPDSNTKEGEAAYYGVWRAWLKTAVKASEYDFAYAVQPAILGGQGAPTFSILIELKSLGRLDEALDFVWKGARSAHRGFDQMDWKSFDINRKQDKAQFIAGLEPLFARTNQVGDLVQFEHDVEFGSDKEYIIHALEKYDQYDGDYVRATVKKYLDPDRAKVQVFKANPKGIKGDVRSEVKFKTKTHDTVIQPEVDPKEARRPLKLNAELDGMSTAEHYTLGNGMDVYLLPTAGSMPIVTAQLSFDVGTAHADNPLVAAWAADMLAPSMDDEALALTGVSIAGEAGDDQTLFGTRAVNIYLDIIIKGLERFVRAGEYNQESIEKRQKSLREQLATKQAQIFLEYQRQIYGGLYGADHRYARVTLPDYAGGFGVDALNKWRRKHYSAGNATLIIAGNFDPKKAKGLISDSFGGWNKGHVDEAVGPDGRARNGAEFVGVVGKETEQEVQVTIAYPSKAGLDGEQAARLVLAEMMNSRMGDIRFKLGSTYGTYAYRATNRGPSAFMMGGAVDAERAGESLKAMRDGIQLLRDGGDQWDIDFVRARRSLIQNLLGESTVSYELLQKLAQIDKYDLELGHYNKLLKLIANMSTAQVKALIKRELDADTELVVLTGTKEAMVKAFEEAGITDYKIVEPDYQ